MSTRDDLVSSLNADAHAPNEQSDTAEQRVFSNHDRSAHMTPPVDIVIPVFNALEDTKKCLTTLIDKMDGWALRIIAVNDGSGEETTSWLREQSARFSCIKLIEHPENRGYTRAANTGLRASQAPYVIILNSDTIVTRDWLQRMVACAESSTRIGIVGPLSNAASWQSVPRVKDTAGFVVNALPPGVTPDDMASIVARTSTRAYPRSTFINGFCFFITRKVIEAIGTFDEVGFPEGYGEENDYCIRALNAGFELAIADDAYVYHAKSKSFGHDRRKELSAAGARTIRSKHGEQKVEQLIARVQVQPELDAQRRLISEQLARRSPQTSAVDPLSLRVLFLLPTKGGGGGAHSVVQEVAGMRRLGVDAKVAVRPSDLHVYLKRYAEIPAASDLFLPYDPDDISSRPEGYDVVVATIYSSVGHLARLTESYPEILPAYYIQDYEPLFFEPNTEEHKVALESYGLIGNAVHFAKTDWLVRTVREHHSVTVHKVEPSLDHDVYRPKPRAGSEGTVKISAMVRPQTKRRGAERTMRVLREIARKFPDRVGIEIFGCESSDERFQALDHDFPFRNHGHLTRTKVADLLAQCDVFIDLSDYQAFGRTGLEAMACGCATLLPAQGGTDEYAVHGRNALVVDTSDEVACVEQLSSLVGDPDLLTRLRRESLKTASEYSVHRAAVSELMVFAEAVTRHRAQHPRFERRRLTLIPARDTSGAITDAGHVRMTYPWQSPCVKRIWAATVRESPKKLPAPGEAEILILQKESSVNIEKVASWLGPWRAAGGKFVLEVDDDLLDVKSLERRNYKRPTVLAERMRWLASAADAVLVPVDTLRSDYLPLNPNVYLVPNFIDGRLWRFGLGSIVDPSFARAPGGPLRIGYIGTPTHDADLALLTPVVERLEDEYGDNIVFEIVGAYQKRKQPWGEQIPLPKNHAYPQFVNWLQRRINWDIGLIPLKESRFTRRKSSLKFIEYSALHVASVCSDVHPFRSVVRNGVNGLLTPNTTDAWYDAIKRLIEDPALREQMRHTAYRDVTGEHAIEANAHVYLDTLQRISEQPKRDDIPAIPDSLRAAVPPQLLPEAVQEITSAVNAVPERARQEIWPGNVASPHAGNATLNARAPESQALGGLWQRKLAKLTRDPAQFLADSKAPGARIASRILGIKRPNDQ